MTRTWEESFRALQDYKQVHGNCSVPAKFQQDRALGQWVEKIRRKAIPISDTQRDRLSRLGVDWETLQQKMDRQWNAKYLRLKEYYEVFGDTRVPAPTAASLRSTDGMQKKPWAEEIGRWVRAQRSFYSQGRLSQEKVRKLDAIRFEWVIQPRTKRPDSTSRDRKWQTQYQKLVEFYKQNGHCMVTINNNDDPSLFHWVKAQREYYKRNALRVDRQELLDSIGFVWYCDDSDFDASHNQRQWETMLHLLEDYKREHGHVHVSRNGIDSLLGNWLSHQKVYWRKGALAKWRIDRLVALGVTNDITPKKRKRNTSTLCTTEEGGN